MKEKRISKFSFLVAMFSAMLLCFGMAMVLTNPIQLKDTQTVHAGAEDEAILDDGDMYDFFETEIGEDSSIGAEATSIVFQTNGTYQEGDYPVGTNVFARYDNGKITIYSTNNKKLNINYWMESSIDFSNCYNLKSVSSISNIDFDELASFRLGFDECSSLEELDLSDANFENVFVFSIDLDDCVNLTKLDLGGCVFRGIDDFSDESVESAYEMACGYFDQYLDSWFDVDYEDFYSWYMNCEAGQRMDGFYDKYSDEEFWDFYWGEDIVSKVFGCDMAIFGNNQFSSLEEIVTPEHLGMNVVELPGTYYCDDAVTTTNILVESSVSRKLYKTQALAQAALAEQGDDDDDVASTGVEVDVLLPSVLLITSFVTLAYVLKSKKQKQL